MSTYIVDTIFNFYNYYLINNDNKLGITYYDNVDLYFNYFELVKETEFCITKKNIIIYNLFNELFNSFE